MAILLCSCLIKKKTNETNFNGLVMLWAVFDALVQSGTCSLLKDICIPIVHARLPKKVFLFQPTQFISVARVRTKNQYKHKVRTQPGFNIILIYKVPGCKYQAAVPALPVNKAINWSVVNLVNKNTIYRLETPIVNWYIEKERSKVLLY